MVTKDETKQQDGISGEGGDAEVELVGPKRQRTQAIGFKKASVLTDVTPTGKVAEGVKRMVLDTKEYPHVVLYDNQGYPRFVPSGTGNVERCLRDSNPLYTECPLCHGEHEPPHYNRCPALPPPRRMWCPVCKVDIVEDQTAVVATLHKPRDEYDIALPEVNTTDHGVRLKWEEHMVCKHPGTARMYGIDEVAVMSKFNR